MLYLRSVVWSYLFHDGLSRTRAEFLLFFTRVSLHQMLTERVLRQHLVSSSKTIRPDIPWGTRYVGNCEMMRSAV